jgi:rSAM/selenodomain-associated transferase 2/rSAM/selenodomain-associated transferase 1
MAAHCVARMRPLQVAGDARVEVHVEGGSPGSVAGWLGDWPRFAHQPEGDLGDRLRSAMSSSFRSGAPSAVVVGSDCPAARATHVRAALRHLATHDVVVGPAEDGGYWLLGVSARAAQRALPVLFERIEWGAGTVLRDTLRRAGQAGLTVGFADRLADVDRPEDLPLWEAERRLERTPPASVSVVIPALDEADRVGAAVSSAFSGGASEVIVVDGGSQDGTPHAARSAGARVIDAPRGRAGQMNTGAKAATCDALVFLHADTTLPAKSAALVCRALSAEGTTGGAFSWGTYDTPLARLFTLAGRMRMAVFRVPYGDQALFMTRRTFEDLGGYPSQPVMEDWELARRIMQLGSVRILPQRALTSSRRWNEGGVVRASAAYLAIIAGYRFGIDPAVLDGWRQPR